jgi:MFS family permease
MENNKDKRAAMQGLKKIARLIGKELHEEEIDLQCSQQKGVAASSYLETLKDFIHFPELRIQLLIQMFQWIIVAFLYYGFTYSWSKLGKNIYWSYVFSGIAEISAALICWFGQDVFGRRMTLFSFYIIAGVSFLLALIPLSFGSQNVLTLEQLMCLIGSMFVSGAWGTSYLYVAEQSPTNHRGKMSAVCSIAARLGSFAGPQASLLFTWDKSITLIFFAILAISAGLVALRLPETKGKKSPNSAQEVEYRRKEMINER